MTADPAFRLSTYLSLALACAALGAAEFPILPEVGVFAVVVIVALAVVYRLEGRDEFLTLEAANNIGIGIGLATAAWAGVRVIREVRVGEFAAVGWLVFLVLLVAPVLMATMVAKLVRREKTPGDYWYLHATGLAAAVLAAAIARRPWEVALLAAYTGAAVWSLARFNLARGGAAPAPGRRAGLAAAARWLVGAAAVAAPVFLLTPASPFDKWEFGPARLEIGFNSDHAVDLNRTGEIEGNAEVAFEVAAEENGRPKNDLSAETRWRGRVLTHYAQGGWRRETAFRFPTLDATAVRVEPWAPPPLGAGQFQLRFSVPATLRSDFLAEPVVWLPKQASPVADVFPPPTPPRPWYQLSDGNFMRNPGRPDRNPNLVYVQHTSPLADPDLGVGFTIDDPGDHVALTNNPVPAVRTYSSRLLVRLIREGKLPAAAGPLDAARNLPFPEQHEAIARAFTDHLSGPEFGYTTVHTRTRPDLDPVVDFLEYTKSGHCERYASALVLMLRSQGIPAAMVLGFKGHEPAGEGKYVVRQDLTHTWATALVSRPGAGGVPTHYWMSLDPSPSLTDVETGTTTTTGSGWAWVWDRLLDATPEERLHALGDLAGKPAVIGTAVGLVGLLAVAWGVWRVRRARTAVGAVNPWLAPLLEVLARHGYAPATGETPREFAARVAAALATAPATAGAAGVPPAWVDTYYEERFGGAALAPDRRAALDSGLGALRTALAASFPGGTR
ncbi:transglutaminase domain-containing protein [bacterium]|nr:transglutaminase domain-containing protein [bacterium]